MTSETPSQYSEAYVWVWLPDATVPVVAGLLSKHGPQWVFNYGRSYLARQAGDALRHMGPAGEAELIAALRHAQQDTRVNAARALAFTDGQPAIAPLFAALDDDSAAVCYWVEQALERRGTGMVYFQP